MSSKTNLKDWLNYWKDHFAGDVEGQAEQQQHLSDKELKRMAGPAGVKEARSEEVDHLSSCPTCLEKWALNCRTTQEASGAERLPPLPLSYGQEDDVMGQTGYENLMSQCGRFGLSISAPQKKSAQATLTVGLVEPPLNGAVLQVRDRKGRVLIEGAVDHDKLQTTVDTTVDIDLSIWTVIKISE